MSGCPVPIEQQPLNEYQDLKESWFFGWGLAHAASYWKTIAWIWGLSWMVTGPVAAASFSPHRSPVQFALMAAIAAGLLTSLPLLRLYLGWSYIRDRLERETIFYEESGWYDGQLWQKSPEELLKERLIVTYQVQPILHRLRQTFGILGLLLVSGGLLWNFL